MASTGLEILNRAAFGAVVVFLSMSMFNRSPSQAAIAVHQDLKAEAASLAPPRRGPAPAMIGVPIAFEGADAGRYPSEAWRSYMNGLLAQIGFDPIDGCAERMRTEAFVYQEDCAGEMVFVTGIYRATANMIRPKSKRIDVRAGTGLPPRDIVPNAPTDIVDRSAGQRMVMNQAYDVQPVTSASPSAGVPSSASAYVDESVAPILNQPVPQTRRRGKIGG